MSPIERFAFYKSRIERLNPKVHAFLNLRLDEAEKEAEAADQRYRDGAQKSDIDGLFIGVKANIAVAGLPHHAGIEAYKDEIAKADAEVVSRLREAGAIVLGILNMHEGALGATTDNAFFGRTQNPWRQGFTPGGSSGGSGAAVAAGLCDFALGSDTMGSVRIPSAYCGVQGHKPTIGAVSNEGVLALSHSLDHIGPHARSVRQLRSGFAVMSGQNVDHTPCEVSSLKCGIWTGGGKVELTDAVKSGFHKAMEQIRQAGAKLTDVEPPDYDYGGSRRAGLLISEDEGAAIHAAKLAENPDGFGEEFRRNLQWGQQQPEEKKAAARAKIAAIKAKSVEVFEAVDFVIAPTVPQTAFAFEEQAPANQADFTAWANFAGLPATAVYTGLSGDGLPLSLQIIGPQGRDFEMLAAAEAIETLFGPPAWPEGFAP